MIFYKIQILFFIYWGISSYSQDSLTYKKLRDEYGKEYYYDYLLKAKVYMINGEKIVIMDEMEIQTKTKFNN